jgi:TolA-binding protein
VTAAVIGACAVLAGPAHAQAPRSEPRPAARTSGSEAAVEEALRAVALAASAAAAQQARIVQLEGEVDRLRGEVDLREEARRRLDQRLMEVQQGGGGGGTWMALAGLLALLSAGLGWRVLALSRGAAGRGPGALAPRADTAGRAGDPATAGEAGDAPTDPAEAAAMAAAVRAAMPDFTPARRGDASGGAASRGDPSLPAWPTAPLPVLPPGTKPRRSVPDESAPAERPTRGAGGLAGVPLMSMPAAGAALERMPEDDWPTPAAAAARFAGSGAAAGPAPPAPRASPPAAGVFSPEASVGVGFSGGASATASRTGSATPAHERTQVLPPRAAGAAAGVGTLAEPSRDVSIEELIDLEQQAEFFIVLGQDEEAIDLLVGHLRETGGSSPLPYLKLMEIYQRRGDTAAYERIRTRFNHRFNAYAPEWGAEHTAGRVLEDYAGVVPRLQQAWARPLDAMAELEALLFRRSRGELFDLPAYRDVLMLYSVARDLIERDPEPSVSGALAKDIDLLLPLSNPRTGSGEFGSTAPHPYYGFDGHDPTMPAPPDSAFGDDFGPSRFDDRPTMPVDLDLTMPAEPPSIFDPLPEPRRR